MLKDLKVVFMGTPEFSINILNVLVQNTNVIGVVTQPDKIIGKSTEKSFTPIKKVALANNIKVLQPEKIRREYEDILALKPDIIITCAYGQIIPEAILNYPKYGCINVHASLLPKLRGGAPIHHAIIDGYSKTGVTIMYMDKGMDTGDIIKMREIPILETDCVGTLHDKLSLLGSELLLETLPSIVSGTNDRIKQNEEEVSFGYNIKREEEIIDFNQDCRTIFNQIRGLNPFPGAYLTLYNKTIKVYAATYMETPDYNTKPNGEIVILGKDKLGIKCLNGIVFLEDIKKEGKRRMKINDYLNGEKEELKGKVVNVNNGVDK